MADSFRFPLATSLLVITLATSALAGSYSDPSGFSLTYPEGWITITGASVNNSSNPLPENIQQWMRKNRLDMSTVKVLILRNGNADEFLENVNVVVTDGEIPLTDQTVKELQDAIPKQYAHAGIRSSNLRMRLEERGGQKMLVSDHQLTFPEEVSEVGTIQQRQFQLPGGGKTFTLTCTARPETFDQWESEFEAAVKSFKGPRSGLLSGALGQVIQSGLIWGLAGAVIGGAVGGVMSIVGKKRHPPSPPPVPTA